MSSSFLTTPTRYLPSVVLTITDSKPGAILALGATSDSSRYSRFCRVPTPSSLGPTTPPSPWAVWQRMQERRPARGRCAGRLGVAAGLARQVGAERVLRVERRLVLLQLRGDGRVLAASRRPRAGRAAPPPAPASPPAGPSTWRASGPPRDRSRRPGRRAPPVARTSSRIRARSPSSFTPPGWTARMRIAAARTSSLALLVDIAARIASVSRGSFRSAREFSAAMRTSAGALASAAVATSVAGSPRRVCPASGSRRPSAPRGAVLRDAVDHRRDGVAGGLGVTRGERAVQVGHVVQRRRLAPLAQRRQRLGADRRRDVGPGGELRQRLGRLRRAEAEVGVDRPPADPLGRRAGRAGALGGLGLLGLCRCSRAAAGRAAPRAAAGPRRSAGR